MGSDRLPVEAVVVAAGESRRTGTGTPKQFVEVAGRPILVHALLPFVTNPAVRRITVVLPADRTAEWAQLLPDRYGMSKVEQCVPGGERRIDSVRAGLEAACAGSEDFASLLVAVHDAARPMITNELLEAVLVEASLHGAALPALSVADTVIEEDRGEWVRLVEREHLRLVQTPQVFRADWLLEAHRAADSRDATDDAQLVQACGHPVRLVPGDPRNLKVTTAEDIKMVSRYLEERG